MNIERLVTQLMEDEGFRGDVYDDLTALPVRAPVGRATLGYGANVQDTPIPRHIAGVLLRDRLTVAIVDALFCVPLLGRLDEQRQEVLVQMAYQLGRRGLLTFERMLTAIAAGDFDRAAAEALESKAARQTPARWQRHARILRGGSP